MRLCWGLVDDRVLAGECVDESTTATATATPTAAALGCGGGVGAWNIPLAKLGTAAPSLPPPLSSPKQQQQQQQPPPPLLAFGWGVAVRVDDAGRAAATDDPAAELRRQRHVSPRGAAAAPPPPDRAAGADDDGEQPFRPQPQPRPRHAAGTWRALELPARAVVTAVAAGEAHALLLLQSGDVYGVGSNAYGQLGALADAGEPPRQRHQQQPVPVMGPAAAAAFTASRAGGTAAATTSSSTSTTSTSTISSSRIAAIAAGALHSAAITVAADGGRLLLCGCNAHAQCGAAAPGDVRVPTLCRPLDGVPLRAVAAGLAHTLVASAHGSVYSLGWGGDGQLGCGGCGAVAVPRLVEGSPGGLDDAAVVAVAAGARHSVALTAAGEVFAWGWNRWGQCCCGNSGEPGKIAAAAAAAAAVVAAPVRLNLAGAWAAAAAAAAATTRGGGGGGGGGRSSSSGSSSRVNVRATAIVAGRWHTLVDVVVERG